MEAYEPAHMANLVITGGAQCGFELNKHFAALRAVAFGNHNRRKRLDRETINTVCSCCQVEQSRVVTRRNSLTCPT